MKTKQFFSLIVMLILATFLLSSCNLNGTDKKKPLTVALIIAGNLGDKSFFDAANTGITRAMDELDVETKVFECNNDASFYSQQMNAASEYGKVVVVVGYEFYDLLKEMANVFNEVNYIYVDNVIEGIPNITGIDYNEAEGSFLAGAFAALMMKEEPLSSLKSSNTVGMIGGMDIPVIRSFVSGYEKGAKYIDPKINVKVVFAGDFVYPANCRKAADAMYKQNINIIFQAAGAAGIGVLDAAKAADRYAIGVDSDQRHLDPEHIVASMVKGVGLSIFESIKRVQDGTFKPGTVYKYGLKENGVDLVYGDESMIKIVPDTIKNKMKDIAANIISGKIKVE